MEDSTSFARPLMSHSSSSNLFILNKNPMYILNKRVLFADDKLPPRAKNPPFELSIKPNEASPPAGLSSRVLLHFHIPSSACEDIWDFRTPTATSPRRPPESHQPGALCSQSTFVCSL